MNIWFKSYNKSKPFSMCLLATCGCCGDEYVEIVYHCQSFSFSSTGPMDTKANPF